MNLQNLLAVLNITALIAYGVNFVAHQGDTTKERFVPIEQRISSMETVNAVQGNDIETLKADIMEIKIDVKAILKTLRPDDYRPAVKDSTVPLVKKVAPDGSPSNE